MAKPSKRSDKSNRVKKKPVSEAKPGKTKYPPESQQIRKAKKRGKLTSQRQKSKNEPKQKKR